MIRKTILFGTILFVSVLVFLAINLGDMAASNESRNATSSNLTLLEAGDISAYRWEAMGRAYEGRQDSNFKSAD